MRLLTVSGSLRRLSVNTALLQAFASHAPATVDVVHYAALEQLPPFHPDREGEPHETVAGWRTAIAGNDAVIFSTPEYAHGMPGVLKNALDWIVGSGELSGKPVTLLQASSRAIHAPASLREVLVTMNARFIDAAALTLDVPRGSTAAEILETSNIRSRFTSSLECLLASVDQSTISPRSN